MSKKGWIGIAAAVCIGLLVIVGVKWFGKRSDKGSGSTTRVGVILPLTGGAASLGKASFNGMQLAVEDYNAKKTGGESKINLIVEDDAADPAKGVSAFQKLITADHVRLVLGPLPSGVVLSVAPLAERNRVVILSPGASAPAITQAGDYIFRNELSEEYGARAQAELAFSRLNFKSFALLYVNNEYGVGTVRVFRDSLTQLGGRIVADEAFSTGATDFRTALTKIKGANPDAIFVVFQDDIVNILRQRNELGIVAAVYTTAIFEDPANLAKLGPLAEGVLYAYYGDFDIGAKSGPSADFVTRYRERFGEAPTYYAALGYDASGILISALRASQFDQGKVKDNLYRVQHFQGISGDTSFDKNGDVEKPVSLKTVRGGHFVPY